MRYIAVVFGCILTLTSFAQNLQASKASADSVLLDEIEITAARYPQNLKNLAAPIQLINKAQLDRAVTGDLSSAFASLPGIQFQSGSAQTIKLTVRGIGSCSQYSTNRTSVYLNDIPLTSGDGTSIFDDIDLSFLSRAEFTKGPYSAWYGSGMGGSLRLITRQQESEKFTSDLTTTVGEYGFIKVTALALCTLDKTNLMAGLSTVSGNGYRQNSSFKRHSGIFTSNWDVPKLKSKIGALVMLSNVKAFTPSSIDEKTFVENPQAAAANWLAVKGSKAYKRMLTSLNVKTKFNKSWSNTAHASYNNYDQYELRPFNILDDVSSTFNVQESVNFRSDHLKVAFGVQALSEKYKWQILDNKTIETTTDAQENRNNLNAFISTELEPLTNLQFSLAANVNKTFYSVTETKVPSRPLAASKYAAEAIISPMFGIMFHPSKLVSIYGSAGHGFSNPTVEESLNSEGILNINLQPEQGWTIDLGFKTRFPNARISFQASGYFILLDDLLVTKRPSEAVFYGENAGSAHLKGLELEFRHQPTAWIKYFVTGSISSNRFKKFTNNSSTVDGNELPGIPQAQLFADIEATLPWRIKLFGTLRYTGKQFADDANNIPIKAWKTVDIGLKHQIQLSNKLTVNSQITVKNTLDEKYASMILINAPSFNNRPPRYYYPALPRILTLSLTLNWN